MERAAGAGRRPPRIARPVIGWLRFSLLALLLFLPGRIARATVPPAPMLPPVPVPSTLETRIWRELNIARSHPRIYADYLEGWLADFHGTDLLRPGHRFYVLHEGRSAVEEAIRYLRRVSPREPLAFSAGMSHGAGDLVEGLGPIGGLSHVGLDGSEVGERLNRYGSWRRKAGEVIQCGTADPREIVALLIVDDNQPARPHRRVLFDDDFQVMGTAIGLNARYEHMCVITFADAYSEALTYLPEN